MPGVIAGRSESAYSKVFTGGSAYAAVRSGRNPRRRGTDRSQGAAPARVRPPRPPGPCSRASRELPGCASSSQVSSPNPIGTPESRRPVRAGPWRRRRRTRSGVPPRTTRGPPPHRTRVESLAARSKGPGDPVGTFTAPRGRTPLVAPATKRVHHGVVPGGGDDATRRPSALISTLGALLHSSVSSHAAHPARAWSPCRRRLTGWARSPAERIHDIRPRPTGPRAWPGCSSAGAMVRTPRSAEATRAPAP